MSAAVEGACEAGTAAGRLADALRLKLVEDSKAAAEAFVQRKLGGGRYKMNTVSYTHSLKAPGLNP